MNACAPGMSMRDFAVAQTAELLRSAADACMLAARSPGAEPVHKMRVSIRRLQQALRLFSQYFRERGVRRVRKELREIMEPAGELRNFDIAIALVRKLGSPTPQLAERRVAAKQQLIEVLGRVARPDLFERWRDVLGIVPNEKALEA
jgi:CHAD domain-containing protein